MAQRKITTSDKPQIDKFKEAARELECDDDDDRFRERVGELVSTKSSKAKPEEKD